MRKGTKVATGVTDSIVRGLLEKKGEKVALIDLRNIESRIVTGSLSVTPPPPDRLIHLHGQWRMWSERKQG